MTDDLCSRNSKAEPPASVLTEAQHKNLYALFMHAPAPIFVLKGPELVFEMANDLYFKIAGRGDLVGKRLLEVLPELRGQGLDEILLKVMKTGETYVGKEIPLRLDRDGDGRLEETYFTFTYAPLWLPDSVGRVMVFCSEVTEQVLARQRIEKSEEAFRQLVKHSQAGVAQTDLTGRFTLVNDRYCEIVGRSAEELHRLQMPDITHPEDLTRVLEAFDKAVHQGTPFSIERRYVKPDGAIVRVQSSVSRIDDLEGRPHGVALITIDITERKQAERALKNSEERFRTIFETAEVSLWDENFEEVKKLIDELKAKHGTDLRAFLEANPAVVDKAIRLVRIRDVNPATLRMFGASRKEDLLASLRSTFVPESRCVFLEQLIAIAEGKSVFSSEAELRTIDGKRINVLLTVGFSPADECLQHVLVTLMDISAQKLVEREREARVAEMERAVRFSEMFVGILGHDLRNPLSAISTAASLLSRRSESERIAKPVIRILTSADRMERMISQLLDLTHIRLGHGIPLERTQVDLTEVSRSITEELEPVHNREIRIESVGDVVGIWDRDRLSQLLSNLVANASQHGTPDTPVLVQLNGSSPEVVQVEVWNRGAIAPELLPVLFEPLRHAGSGRERREHSSGLGLGLYITQQIALAHGGTIRAESNDADGTRFIVELPRRLREEVERGFSPDPHNSMNTTDESERSDTSQWNGGQDADGRRRTHAGGETAQVLSSASDRGGNVMPYQQHHILVIDDDRDLRDSVMEALEDAGYSVASASDGVHALLYLRSASPRPDLILLDLQMPNMNGAKFREEQLKSVELADIPVVVVTADPNAKEMVISLNTGGFLRKPLKIPSLLEMIPRVLEASRSGGNMT